jgi:hypothetical protein
VEVLTPGERPDCAFRATVVELRIRNCDCGHESKDSCEREGIGHCVLGEDVGIDPSQETRKGIRASRRSNKIQE